MPAYAQARDDKEIAGVEVGESGRLDPTDREQDPAIGHVLHDLDRDDDPPFLPRHVAGQHVVCGSPRVWEASADDERGDAPVAQADDHTLDAPEHHVVGVNIVSDPRLQHALLRRIDDHARCLDVVDDAAHLRHTRGDFLCGGAHIRILNLAAERHDALIGIDEDTRLARPRVARERRPPQLRRLSRSG